MQMCSLLRWLSIVFEWVNWKKLIYLWSNSYSNQPLKLIHILFDLINKIYIAKKLNILYVTNTMFNSLSLAETV